ncbi:MAG: fumarylacetoacetase [Cellvibrionaceae bacterium]|nr:fumarylacetoacetase [Cellvibrionaceae bacterium]
MSFTNETHDPQLRCWLQSAEEADCEFPIQNLPFAEFRRQGSNQAFRGGVAIGDQIVDLAAVATAGVFAGAAQQAAEACAAPALNHFMSLGKQAWSALRLALSRALRQGAPQEAAIQACLVPQDQAEYSLPCQIGDYTDFYSSVHHATAVGSLFRPDKPLLPNYKWIPVGYHGRTSSIAISGHCFYRPQGQTMSPDAAEPSVEPCKRLDHELELGIFIGAGNAQGEPIPIQNAEDHVFGLCLFNDWSARDIQAWEYQPLGPFLAKNFASTLSPWIVTLEALAPFRAPLMRPESDPRPLPYLHCASNSAQGSLDIELQVLIQTERMRKAGQAPEVLATSNFVHSYWTIAQLVAHHSVNGCNLRPGDLFGSGTQSGPNPQQAGSMLELSRGGKQALRLRNGESRTFIEDGDTVILRGACQRQGAARIGFGEVTSTVLPAKTLQSKTLQSKTLPAGQN